jgi:hypothetical protein
LTVSFGSAWKAPTKYVLSRQDLIEPWGESAAERNLMQFVSDYMKAIDFIALAALVVIAVASLYRAGTVWLLIAAIVVAIWGISRLFGLF